jgi:hypothetical protein
MNIEKNMSMKKEMNLEKVMVIHGKGKIPSHLRSGVTRTSSEWPKLQVIESKETTHYFHVSPV